VRGVALAPASLAELARQHGGELRPSRSRGEVAARLVPVTCDETGPGDLTLLAHPRFVSAARRAVGRGALLLVDAALIERPDVEDLPAWVHPQAAWALAELVDARTDPVLPEPVVGPGASIDPSARLFPGVRVGARVRIGAGAVVGAPGFGYVTGPDGRVRDVPHRGGVVLEDDVHIGPLATVAAGTIGATIVRRGAKLDAQVHVGHNADVGEGTMIAAQSGLAGSVVLGRGVLVGGQVGIADHVTVGDGARIAAKSGVIGDVPAGAVVAGYPAVDRPRWLRGLAELYRLGRTRARPRDLARLARTEPQEELADP
jgi:UDP-3-O-[3-hydroxymyristoyl] glucosamine N-acyltransferase